MTLGQLALILVIVFTMFLGYDSWGVLGAFMVGVLHLGVQFAATVYEIHFERGG